MVGPRKITIGIDPDIDGNGVALIDRSTRSLTVQTLSFPATLEFLKSQWEAVRDDPSVVFMVYVEAGWLNRGNWHVTENRSGKISPQAYAAAVGTSTGECNAVSKKLLECCEYYGVPAQPQKPFRKCWKGRDRKITHAELKAEADAYRVNFRDGRSNQEERDAALIALMNM